MLRKCLLFILIPLFALRLAAVTRVTFEELQNNWQSLSGQTVRITTPLVVCGAYYDSVVLAPRRLYVPEEHATGLADGDSTEYYRIDSVNRSLAITLQCPRKYDLNLGATVKNLTARVAAPHRLQTGKIPRWHNYRPGKRIPDLGKPDIVVCAANIQNYFCHLGGYASRRTTPAQHALQARKVATALTKTRADLFALCELEKGPSAPQCLTSEMNMLAGRNIYDFVNTGVPDGDTISVGFIYDKRRIRPYGELRSAYPNPADIYCCRFLVQGFEDLQTGERFVISLNHLRSKRGTPEESARKRNNNVKALLECIRQAYADSTYYDPDILLLGDYNSYSMELPLQTIVRAGYDDLLSGDTTGYSYSYKGACGYLDRAFASPSMTQQVTAVKPLHWNTDFYYSAGFSSKYNFRGRVIPQEKPETLHRVLTRAAKRNMLFRFADHDPLLIGLRLNGKTNAKNNTNNQNQ